MNKEISNTGKPVQQSGEQEPEDKASMPTTQDNATLIRRRNLLKGLGAAPLVMTLHSGAAMAAQSNNLERCVGPQNGTPDDCTAVKDNYLRSEVLGTDGRDANGIKNDLYSNTPSEANKKFCLVSVDTEGKVWIDDNNNKYVNDSTRVVTTSCWTSFV